MDEGIKKKKSVLFIVIIAIVIVIAVVFTVTFFLKTNSPEYKLKLKLEEADKYLLELNYDQAVIAYKAAIEIDPMCVSAYMGAVEAYIQQSDQNSAIDILKTGYSQTQDESICDKLVETCLEKADEYVSLNEYLMAIQLLDEITNLTNDQRLKDRKAEYLRAIEERNKPQKDKKAICDMVSKIEVAYTMDNVVLGETDLGSVKAEYGSRPYAKANMMNNDSTDTVYTCYGMETPIPEGNKEMEFGFIFASSADGGNINMMACHDKDILCSGCLYVGDTEKALYDYLGIPESIADEHNFEYIADNGKQLNAWPMDAQNFLVYKDGYYLRFRDDHKEMAVMINDGKIYSVSYSIYE